MVARTLIEQTVVVKKVITKAASKFGKASIIVPFNGKDEFLGLNDGVDENAFIEGNSYKLGIAVSKTGKRYVQEIVADLGVEAKVEAKPEVKTAPAGDNKTFTAEVVTGLDRDARITHMNIANVAATLAAGDIELFDKAFQHVEALYKKKGVL